MQIIYKKSIG